MADTSLTPPSALVIFGITGDLAKRKVLPAYYHLLQAGQLAPESYLVGTSRREIAVEDIMSEIESAIIQLDGKVDQAVMETLRSQFTMLQLDPEQHDSYDALVAKLDELEANCEGGLQRLFYLSVPPQAYTSIVEKLGQHGLNKPGDDNAASRLLVEKPFGYDLASAKELITQTAEHFSEEQVFRIDHYLAKEMSQNLLHLRQNNPLFAAIWNKDYINRITVTADEKIGVEGRGNFYDQVGALRDLIQSHLMQLLSITLMQPPETVTPESIHAAKLEAVDSITPIDAGNLEQHVVRGQYKGYREEIEQKNSTTETFISVVLHSEANCWQGVPLQLTTGKALTAKQTEIRLDLKGGGSIALTIDPQEGMTLPLKVTAGGLGNELVSASLNFSYADTFSGQRLPDAYERVIVEAMQGDQMSFASDKEVLSSWRILQPLIDAWQQSSEDLQFYEQGSGGPSTSVLSSS